MPGGQYLVDGVRDPVYIGASVFTIIYNLTGSATLTGGAGGAFINPAGVDLLIVDALVRVTTAAGTPANTMDIGIAANGTTSNDTLLDGLTSGAGIRDARKAADGGTNGAVPRLWAAGQYVTVTPVASTAGLVGTLILQCCKA